VLSIINVIQGSLSALCTFAGQEEEHPARHVYFCFKPPLYVVKLVSISGWSIA